jgi:hypothetical protein
MRGRQGMPLRLAAVLSAVWLGGLLCVGLLAAPAAFAVLERPMAGRMVGALFAREAAASVVLGALLMLLQRWGVRRAQDDEGPAAASEAAPLRSQADAALLLPAAAIFCSVLGYYALQPWMEQARAGGGPLTFGQLHAISVGFFLLKTVLVVVLVAVLAWRLSPRSASSR